MALTMPQRFKEPSQAAPELDSATSSMEVVSRLLSLPPEIRNIIYRLLLVPPDIAYIRSSFSRNPYSDYDIPIKPFTPSLLSTCRQIHAEASPILYGENVFTADPSLLTSMPFLLNSFRPIRTAALAALIRRWYIHVRLDCDLNFSRAQATAAFSGAHELEIDVYEAMFGGSDYTNLLLFADVRAVKHAKVRVTVQSPFVSALEASLMLPVGADGIKPEDMPPRGFFGSKGEYDVWVDGGR